jgi:hypothetical protein
MTMLYRCELINGDIVEERLFREGDSPEDVKEQLDIFQWPEEAWRITPANEIDED